MRKAPEKIIDYSFTKLFQPRKHQVMTKVVLSSLELTILIINFWSANLKTAVKTLQLESFKKHLVTKKILLTARQSKKIINVLLRPKF